MRWIPEQSSTDSMETEREAQKNELEYQRGYEKNLML